MADSSVRHIGSHGLDRDEMLRYVKARDLIRSWLARCRPQSRLRPQVNALPPQPARLR